MSDVLAPPTTFDPPSDTAEPQPSGLRGLALIQDEVRRLPDAPGVYRMIGTEAEVLYVGKARSLKKRVGHYAQGRFHSQRIGHMVALTRSMEFITTETEAQGAAAGIQPYQEVEAPLQRGAARRQELCGDPAPPRPPGAAGPQAPGSAHDQGRLFRAIRQHLGGEQDGEHPAEGLPAALLFGQRLRQSHPPPACCTRSSGARRLAPA